MATVILRHQTLSLRQPFPLESRTNLNLNIIKHKSSDGFSSSSRRKRSPLGFKSNARRESESMVIKSPGVNLVMGQVRILKRGKTLIAAAKKTNREWSDGSRDEEEFDSSLGSTNRLGSDPETMQKQIKFKEFKIGDGFYAGSSFFSPPPSSDPVSDFLGRTARVCP